MSILTKPLFALSKTDTKLIQLCSNNAYNTQASYGLFILIIGIFAFFSSSYALKMTLNISGVYFIAAIYATLIMLIDREIVSASNKNRLMIGTRVVLAVCIGMVVSVPLELRMFAPQIEQKMKAMLDSDNQIPIGERKDAEAQYKARIREAENDVKAHETEIRNLEKRITNELLAAGQQFQDVTRGTERPGKGPVYQRLVEQKRETEQKLTKAQAVLRDLKAGEPQEMNRIDDTFKRNALPGADDLLSRYTALGAVKQHPQRGWDAWFMAWGVRLLLIMLEVTPALIKLLQEENEYDALVRAVRRRSITRINAIANDHMEQLAQNGGQNPTPTLIAQLKADPLTS